ncbi:MAG: endonuclease/exonuclease/phosphatase family protein [Anaerolineae bacterium]|nr:endonuclease/exonuclease/phosphatase family protein [Anaerolineae bacterium]
MRRTFGSRLISWGINLYVIAIAGYLLVRFIIGDRFWMLSLLNTFAYVVFLPLIPLLLIGLLMRQPRPTLRLLPVMALGGLWFAPYLPKAAPVSTGPTLTVLTQNVWGNNHDLTAFEDWLRGSGADVLLLQEISPAYATDGLPRLADVFPYQAAQSDDSRWGGNLILSRYPIIETTYVDLDIPDTPSPVRALIDVEGQVIAVYNVHMAWPGRKQPRLSLPFGLSNHFGVHVALAYDDRLRNRQIANLLDHLQEESYPFIIGGDFNTSDQTPTYQQLTAIMRDSFREAGSGAGMSWPVSSARGMPAWVPPLIRIDYIFHSDDLRALRSWQAPPLGSDHLGLVSVISLES